MRRRAKTWPGRTDSGPAPTPPADVAAPEPTNGDGPMAGTPIRAAPKQGLSSNEPNGGTPLVQPQSENAALVEPNSRPEEGSLSVHTILKKSNALQAISDIPQACSEWASRLSQHCGLCNNWAMDKSSVKCHLIRKHATEWHSHSQEVSKLCISHKHLLRRDAHCPFCDKMVQCPVLFQVCLLHLMRVSTDSVLHRSVCESRIQAGEFTFFTMFAQPLSHFCLLCAQEGIDEHIVDVQQLKRHLRNAHSLTKESLASICDSHFASIEMQRPCSFCSQQYQKSPQLHKSKCVPLVQILALTYGQHGRPGIGRGTRGGSVGALQPIVHTHPAAGTCPGESRDEQRQPGQQGRTASQVLQSQRQGRQGQRSGQETTRTLDGWRHSVGRQEPELGTPDAEDAGSPPRTLPEPASSGQNVRALLQHKRHEHPDVAQGGHQQLAEGLSGEENNYHATHSSPHQPLAGAGGKVGQTGIRPGGDETLRGLRTSRWSYTAWGQEKQQSLPTEEPPLANQEIVTALKILKAAALTDGVIHKFSPLHKLTDSPQSKVVVFQLVLTTRPTAEKVLTNLAVASLVGMRIRPERLQISPLAKQMMNRPAGV